MFCVITSIVMGLTSCSLSSLSVLSDVLDVANSIVSPSYSSSSVTPSNTSSTIYATPTPIVQPTQGNIPIVETSTQKSGGNYESMYRMWENRARSNYNSLTNLGTKVKTKKGKNVKGSTRQSMNTTNYTSMKRSLREAQQSMSRIRREASSQGITIMKSEYEDIQVSY